MITGDNIAVIDRQGGFNITTHKTHFEMVMRYIATGVYGGGYGSKEHRTVLDHFEQQIKAQRENMDRQDAEEAARERKIEERKKGPTLSFENWWAKVLDYVVRNDEPKEYFTNPSDFRGDWEGGYTPEDAVREFLDSTG